MNAPSGDLQGRVLAGGAASRAFFADLLGLGDLRETRVTAVGWLGDHVEVEISGPNEALVVLHLERFQKNAQRLLVSSRLAAHYRGERLWPELERKLRAVKLGDTTLEQLAGLIGGGADVDPAHDRLPRGNERDQRAYDRKSLLSTWGSTEIWSEFFAVAEIARGRLDSLDIFDRCSFIQHCDRDCLLLTPKGPAPMVETVNYPWLDRVRRIGRPNPPVVRHGGPMRTTDLRERDVVMGSLGKLERLLDSVVRDGVDHMLFLSCTCVPFVTGEDVESLVKRYRKRLDKPFFFLTTTPQSSVGVFREVLVRQRQLAEANTPAPRAHSVNLVGYTRDPTLGELTALLAEAGVAVNEVFIPEMNFAAIPRLPRAPLHVLYPNDQWQSLYDQLLFESRVGSVMPPAPFGLRGTEEWLRQVAAAAGVEADARAIVARAAEPWRGELEQLRRQAAEHRLGIVVSADEVHRLVDPAGLWGVPLIPMLEELGFGLDVMIRVADRASAATSARQVHALLREPHRHSIKAFRDRPRLTGLLDEGRFDAVYTDHLFDRRLTSAGKAGFSLQEVEKGIAGAVRTTRRLLAICRLPLYRRYRKYLRPEPVVGTP